MGLTARSPVEADVEALAALIEEIERFYGAKEIQPLDERIAQVRAALFSPIPLSFALLAENDRREMLGLAAYSYLWPAAGSTHSMFLKELYVREGVRGAGVGRFLIEELKRVASAREGCSRLEWETDVDNAGARAFYAALGVSEFPGKVFYRVQGEDLKPSE